MRPGIKFYTKLEETSLEPKKYNKELKEAGLSGKDILFTERKEHSGNYIVFFENNGIYEYHPYDNINGLASGQKARTLEGCISRAHCMGLFENDTGVAKQMKAADGLLDVKVNFKESLRNRLREGAVCPDCDDKDFEADVDFWYGEYCKDVDAGMNNPDVGIAEYIAGKIDKDYPTKSPEQFKSLVKRVRDELPKVEKNWSVNIREAQIGRAFHSEGFNESSNKTSRNRLREKMYMDELSDQLENDILSAANESADGPHVVLTDVLDTLEYEFGYNYKGELYPNLSVIVKYLEQAGYIVEE